MAAVSRQAGPERATTVTVAVPTFRRPQRLAQALPLLLQQASSVPASYRVAVLVIDNDPDASAAAVIEAHQPCRMRYVHEPQPGISAARNRALLEAGTDLLVFIDDDEHPEPGWLRALLDTWVQTGAAGVGGRVVSVFEEAASEWVMAGDFWRRRRLPSGTPVEVVATGNLLLDLRQVLATDVRFSDLYGLTGGEDTQFSRRLSKTGLALVWCDESVAVDTIPAIRATRRWLLQRSVSVGNGESRVELDLCDSLGERLFVRSVLLVKGSARVIIGGIRAWWGGTSGSLRDRARGERTLCRGLGTLAGASGWVYAEYARSGRHWLPAHRLAQRLQPNTPKVGAVK